MIVQITSGQGPIECELAVYKLFKYFSKLDKELEIIEECIGTYDYTLSSITFISNQDYSSYQGTIQWASQSKYRKDHKRKNWFISVFILPEITEISKEADITFSRFHSGGNGGQNVNKVETGVRVIHNPTNIRVTSTKYRTQQQNKKDALKKLNALLMLQQQELNTKHSKQAWSNHTHVVRGNPVAKFVGEKFLIDK